VGKILSYSNFSSSQALLEKKIGPFYHDELNPTFWTKEEKKDGETEWVFDDRVRRKLVRIANEFFESFEEILKKKSIVDIRLTGSLANYNYTNLSDLDVHVIVDLEGIDDDNPKILKTAMDGLRFIWNIRHNITIRGYDVEMYVQDAKEEHTASGLYSLLNGEWIKEPKFDPPTVDDANVDKKYQSIAYEIEQLESRLLLISSLPSNAKELYKRAVKLKEKIMKMRKEGLSKDGEFSIGNLAFKKLRNEGYIEKLIELISKSYDKIYTEQ
jgi:predicted nucleotidyltransferase